MKNHIKHVKMIIGDIMVKKKRQIIPIIATLFFFISVLLLGTLIILKPDILKQHINFGNKAIKNPNAPIQKKLTIIDEDSNSRPIAVMIDNNVGNNSHYGLQQAYLTYEIIVEGGLTRLMAIYKDKNVSQIGPIRSSRHYFLDYCLENDAIYAHFGWSPYAKDDIKKLDINNINGLYDSTPFWRVNWLYAPHNVFTSTEKLYSYAKNKNYQVQTNDWQFLNYSVEEINLEKINSKDKNKITSENNSLEAITANNIYIEYSYGQKRSFIYDTSEKVYHRYMNNNPHIDAESKKTLTYKNIIVEVVNNRTLDSEGRQELNTTGSGEGYYITNGHALPIIWEKQNRKSKTAYKYKNGDIIRFNDGNTIIEIIPSMDNINMQQ